MGGVGEGGGDGGEGGRRVCGVGAWWVRGDVDCGWGFGVPAVFGNADDAGVAGKGAGVVAVVGGVLAGVVGVVELAHFGDCGECVVDGGVRW